jgi:hypothetical protein
MKRIVSCAVFCLMSCSLSVAAQTFSVTMNSGNPLIFQAKAGGRSPVSSQTTAGMGDSLILSAGDQVTLGLETNSRLIFKGPGVLALTGDSSAAYLSFDQGQAFLDRVEPTTFSVLTFWVRNYMFVPVGTAAAIKVMSNLTPAVAVIEGKVLMQSPTGESLEIQTGNFGSIETSGRIVSGNLGKYSIAALEKWSGVKAERLYSDAKAASSLEVIDQEFTVIGDGAPAAPATSRAAAGGAKTAVQAEQNQETAAATTNDTGTKSREETGEEKTAPSAPDKTSFELSAGAVTVDDQQWTRLVLGIDVPIWKFGIFFDLETFFNQEGKLSNKGWNFRDDPVNSISRKIRYIRFGHEKDPLFIKVGGLSDVTLGYGFIVDRFTNMLHYPDQKLIGGQFYLNDVSPVGITLQLMGSDFLELRDNYRGGMGAARLAVRPLKTSGLPIISNLAIGATYSYDRNVYAPARDWKLSKEQRLVQSAYDRGVLPDPAVSDWLKSNGYNPDSLKKQIDSENVAKHKVSSFGIYGGDISLPIISTPLVSLDLYAQSGIRADSVRGWGFGAPGAALKVWRLSASIEYRHTEGRFVPGFFGPYYLDERLVRSPSIYSKAGSLKDDTLNGVFGRLGFDIANVIVVDGAYQYLVGKTDTDKDQRFEITGRVGSLIVNKIPKIKKLEAYLYKTNIGSDIVKYDTLGAPVIKNGSPTYDRFFERTPFLYYGYRLGFEISPGATLLCDTRFGYSRDSRGRLTSNNNVIVQTAFSF